MVINTVNKMPKFIICTQYYRKQKIKKKASLLTTKSETIRKEEKQLFFLVNTIK